MSIPTISPLPPPPGRTTQPASFTTMGDAFLGAFPAFRNELNALGSWMGSTATTAEENASAATNAAAVATAAANFKGNWSDLTGPLAIPASVYHDSRLWLLLENLADVTASEPGVDPEWTPTTVVGVSRFVIIDSADNITISSRIFANMTASGKTITLPPDAPVGAECGGAWGDWADTLLDGNGANIRDGKGVWHADFVLDVPNESFTVLKTTDGWIFI